MVKGCVLILLGIVVLCITADAHKYRKWKPGVESFFNALKREVDDHLKRSIRTAIPYEVSTQSTSTVPYTPSEFSKGVQTDIQNFFNALNKAVASHAEKNKLYSTSTEEMVSTASQVTPGYTEDVRSTAGYTEEVVSRGSQATSGYAKEAPSTAGSSEVVSGGRQATPSYSEDGSMTATIHRVSPVQDYPAQFGSIKGMPGVHFPNYTDIPLTSFNCFDKKYQPGFYADLETGCQVFHVCWPNRRESFLCPLGTTFNQALLACDYWYSTNCSLAPHYFNVNAGTSLVNATDGKSETLSSMISALLEKGGTDPQTEGSSKVASATPETAMSFISQFLPVKAKVVVYPEAQGKRAKVVASASIGRDAEEKVPQKKPLREPNVAGQPMSTPTSRPTGIPTSTPTSQSSDVQYSTAEPTSTTEMPKMSQKEKAEAYKVAVDIFIKRLFAAFSSAIQDIQDVFSRKYTERTTKTPVEEKPKYTAHHDFHEYDEATRMLLDRISHGLTNFLRDGLKNYPAKPVTPRDDAKPVTPRDDAKPVTPRDDAQEKPKYAVYNETTRASLIRISDLVRGVLLDGLNRYLAKVQNASKLVTSKDDAKPVEKHTVTQLNPKFIIKPVDVSMEEVVEHEESASQSTPEIKVANFTIRTTKKPRTLEAVSRQKPKVYVSPLTKKAIEDSYVKVIYEYNQ